MKSTGIIKIKPFSVEKKLKVINRGTGTKAIILILMVVLKILGVQILKAWKSFRSLSAMVKSIC